MPPSRHIAKTPDRPLDLTRDLRAAARLAASPESVDRLLADALSALGRLIPFDLAAILQLDGDQLRVRVATGPLDGPAVRRHHVPLARFPSIRKILESGQARAFTERDHEFGDGDPYDGVLDLPHGHSCMVVPLAVGPERIGVMTLDRSHCETYPPDIVRLADVFGRLLALAILYGEQSTVLSRFRDQLEEQNRLLAESLSSHADAVRLIDACPSPSMVELARLARQVAMTDTPVLITGETGTGKEVLARAIHAWSRRASQPLVSINCAALPPSLIESELFGHVRGAFSGASQPRMGRFQAANGGTLLLDEIGEIPLDLQAKLLRVLQDGCFEPVGSDRTVRVDVRILAATNVDLQAAAADKRFRPDLYYRLAVFPLAIPPLRTRPADIGPIARGFLDALARRTGREPFRLSESAVRALEARPWTGNVRELVNMLERATILAPASELEPDSFGEPAPSASVLAQAPHEPGPVQPLREVERQHILRALDAAGGRLYGNGGAAALLGIKGTTLYSRMKKLGLPGPRQRARTLRSA